MAVEIKRFEVYWVSLDPTFGKEIKKTRPCTVISPDEMNANITTIIIAPMTTVLRSYPSRITCYFDNKECQIVLDQIRTIDKRRLVKRYGVLDIKTQKKVSTILAEMFSP